MDEYINTLSKSFLEKFSFEGSHNLFLVHQTIIQLNPSHLLLQRNY